MTKYKCFFNEIFLSTESYEIYETTFLVAMRITFPLSFTIPRSFFFSFRHITIIFYIKKFAVIIILLICRTLRLSIIIPFNNFELSSSKKLEKEGINKKSSMFEKFLELLFLLGFLWEKRVRKVSLHFKLLVQICWSLFLLLFCKN